MGTDIRKLLDEALRGNRDAYGDMVGELYARMSCFVRVLLWDTDRTDDVTQEVFVTGYVRLDTYDPRRSDFYSWLKGIAGKLAANENRKYARRRKHAADYLNAIRVERAHEMAKEHPDALDTAIERLGLCLQRLPGRIQDLFTRFYFEGSRLMEMAAAHDMSPGAMKMTLMRGRMALRKCLREFGGDV